jgi:hypothetical protein
MADTVDKDTYGQVTKDSLDRLRALAGCSGWKAGFYIMLVLTLIAILVITIMYFINKP